MTHSKWKLAVLLSAAIMIFLVASGWWLWKKRTDELENLYIKAFANYTHSTALVLQKPAVILNGGFVKFGPAKFCLVGERQSFLAIIPEAEADIDSIEFFKGIFRITEIRLNKPAISAIDHKSISEPWEIVPADIKSTSKIEIQRILVHQGNFSWQKGKRKLAFGQINLSAAFLGQQEPELKGDFILQTQADARISGNLAFKTKLHYYSPNLTFRHASISFTPHELPVPGLSGPMNIHFDGALNIDTSLLRIVECKMSWPDTAMNLRGAASLEKGSLSAEFDLESVSGDIKDNSKSGIINLQGFMESQSNTIHLEEMTIQIGRNTGAGDINFTFSENAATPEITGKINFGQILLNDLPVFLKLFGDAEKTGPWPRVNVQIGSDSFIHDSFAGTNLKFAIVGNNGHYAIKNFSFHAANGDIHADMDLDLPAQTWKLAANGKKINFDHFSLPFCLEPGTKGLANFKMNASGKNLHAPESGLSGNLEMQVDNFYCSPTKTFMEMFSNSADKFFLPKIVLDRLIGKMSFQDNQGNVEIIEAKNRKMRTSGSFLFKLRPFAINGRLTVGTQEGDTGLDLSWPINYTPAFQYNHGLHNH